MRKLILSENHIRIVKVRLSDPKRRHPSFNVFDVTMDSPVFDMNGNFLMFRSPTAPDRFPYLSDALKAIARYRKQNRFYLQK